MQNNLKNYKNIKIAYIGGGSRAWAHNLMNDLATESEIGGDDKLIDSFYEVLTGTAKAETGLAQSVESHLIALAAEESRKRGEVIELHK